MRSWVAVVVAVVGLGLVAGCAQKPKTPPFTGEPYLLVWAGDADRQNADFLAVIDADWSSPTYGKVLKTYPVRSRGNEPHRLLGGRDDRRVFGSGLLTNRTFVFDLAQPLAARLRRVDDPGPERAYWAPHEYASLPNGHVVAACSERARYRGDPRELLGAPGGLLEFTADGQLVREIGAADPAARHLIIAPYATAAALYASDSVHTPSALFRLVFDHGAGALGGGFAITPDDRFLVRALTGAKR